MNTNPLNPDKVSKEQLLSLAEKVPGARIGMKVAILMLVLEGERTGWIAKVLGQTRMNVNRWTRAVNKDGVEALIPKKQPGRPTRMTPKIVAQLESDLKETPQSFGLDRERWDGPALAMHVQRQFGIELNVRQAQYWRQHLRLRRMQAVNAVNNEGVEAEVPKIQPERPARMTPIIVAQIVRHLQESPRLFGLNRVRWDGSALAMHVQRYFGIKLNVQQVRHWMPILRSRANLANQTERQAKASDAKQKAETNKM